MTSSDPLVSVLMPAYNASQTIRQALASLLAQSYQNWECIVVDDGSTDDTVQAAQSFRDRRIVILVLDKNYGRGVARQRCLERARGVYVTMLDADDWLYPDKLEYQVRFMENNPDVSLHSMGMAIESGGRLLSVRRPDRTVDRVLDSLERIFIPHAPSMLRREHIGSVRYDERFRLAQDQDFLRRVLVGRRYVVDTKVGYCYAEGDSVTMSKVYRGYLYNAWGFLKLWSTFGMAAVFASVLEVIKIPYSLAVSVIRGRDYVLASRSCVPAQVDARAYAESRAIMLQSVEQAARLVG